MKSLIATTKYFLLKEKNAFKSVLWVPEFGCPNRYTGLSNDLDTSLLSLTNLVLQKISRNNDDDDDELLLWYG